MDKKNIHHINKSFGQHFLHDNNILNLMAKYISPESKNIIEIGGGTGNLTKLILHAKEFKVIEIDKYYADLLRESLNINVINKNCMDEDYNIETIVGNLPYNISVQFIIKILIDDKFLEAFFLIQKEVAERMIAKPRQKKYGSLTVLIQLLCDVKILFNVGPQAFIPRPKVDSSFIYIKYNNNMHIDKITLQKFHNQLKIWFQNRRKKFLNTNRRVEEFSPQELFNIFLQTQ